MARLGMLDQVRSYASSALSSAIYSVALDEHFATVFEHLVCCLGGLGVSAAADWAGLKPMALPKALGRALADGWRWSGPDLSTCIGASLGADNCGTWAPNVPLIHSGRQRSRTARSASLTMPLRAARRPAAAPSQPGANGGATINPSQGASTFTSAIPPGAAPACL
jgi:hypothetical protein